MKPCICLWNPGSGRDRASFGALYSLNGESSPNFWSLFCCGAFSSWVSFWGWECGDPVGDTPALGFLGEHPSGSLCPETSLHAIRYQRLESLWEWQNHVLAENRRDGDWDELCDGLSLRLQRERLWLQRWVCTAERGLSRIFPFPGSEKTRG